MHAPKERLDERRGLESEREKATAAFAKAREASAVAEAKATPLTEQFTTAEGQVASLNAQHANAKQWLAWDGRAATDELLERDVEGPRLRFKIVQNTSRPSLTLNQASGLAGSFCGRVG